MCVGVSAANQPAESQLRDRREFRPARGRTDRVECCDARAGRSKRHPVDTVRVLPRAHHPPRGTPPTQPRDGNPRPPPRTRPPKTFAPHPRATATGFLLPIPTETALCRPNHRPARLAGDQGENLREVVTLVRNSLVTGAGRYASLIPHRLVAPVKRRQNYEIWFRVGG